MDTWHSIAASGDTVTYTNWNNMVDEIHISHSDGISGSYLGHSGNMYIHYPSGTIKTWLDNIYAPTGSSGTPSAPISSVQYNSGGSFGGDSHFMYSPANLIMSGTIHTHNVYFYSSLNDSCVGIELYEDTGQAVKRIKATLEAGVDDNYFELESTGDGESPYFKIDISGGYSTIFVNEGMFYTHISDGESQLAITNDGVYLGCDEHYMELSDDLCYIVLSGNIGEFALVDGEFNIFLSGETGYLAMTTDDFQVKVAEESQRMELNINPEGYYIGKDYAHLMGFDGIFNVQLSGSMGGFYLSEGEFYITCDNDNDQFYLSSNAFEMEFNDGGKIEFNPHSFRLELSGSEYVMYMSGSTKLNTGFNTANPLYLVHVSGDFYAETISGGSIQQSILTDKLDTVYAPSGTVSYSGLTHISGDTQISGWNETAFTNSGLKWNGSNWVVTSIGATGTDTSSQVSLISGITSDGTIWHDGSATNLYLASSQEYQQAYGHSSNARNLYYPSSLGNTLNTSYTAHSGNSYPHSSNLRTWLNNIYAASGVAGNDTSSQVTLASGLADSLGGSLWHDGDATTLYLVSSNEYDQAYAFSSNAKNLYYPSSTGNSLNTSYVGHSSNATIHYASSQLYSDLYPSSLGNSLKTSYEGHSSNSLIHYPSSSLDTLYAPSGEFTTLSGLTDTNVGSVASGQILKYNGTDWIPGSDATSTQWSSSSDFWGHSSNTNIHYTSGQFYDGLYPSSLGNTLNASYTGHSSNTFIHYTSGQFYSDFYPSSDGNTLNTSYTGHSSNVDIHFPSSQMTTWFDQVYAASGTTGGLTHISGDTQITSWDEAGFTNSGLMWDGSNWIAKSFASGGSGGGTFQTGWALVSSTSLIAHGYGSIPSAVGISPSGSDTFAYSIEVDATNIKVYLSVSGTHWVNWYAGGGISDSVPNYYVYPDDEQVSPDGSNNLYFSGQGSTVVSSGQNTIIISSQVGSAGNLSDLDDYTGTAHSGQFLKYNGTHWIGVSGSFIPRYATIPTASEHQGELIRVSGGASQPTYAFMSVKNSSDSWVWMQIGVTA